MIMNASAAYLELHTFISLPSNWQTFVANSRGHSHSSLLQLDDINFLNITTQKRPDTLCIW